MNDRIGVVSWQAMMVCSKHGDAGYREVGEYPYSWQFVVCSCGGTIHPDLNRGRSQVLYRDGHWEWQADRRDE